MDIQSVSNVNHCTPPPGVKPGKPFGTIRLFVYGTLMRGQPAHRLMRGARLIGRAATRRGFALHDLGPYPAAVRAGRGRIRGELYAMPAAMLRRLDAYENCPAEYRRAIIATALGAAWIYVYPRRPRRGHVLIHGDWRRRGK